MTKEAIDAMLDQLETAMRESAEMMVKLKAPSTDGSMRPSQSLRMMSICVMFGEIIASSLDSGDRSAMEMYRRMVQELNEREDD